MLSDDLPIFLVSFSHIREMSQTHQEKKQSSTIPSNIVRNRRPFDKKKNSSCTVAFFFYQREFGVWLKEQERSFS